jgi:hypothetical protein
LLLLSSAVVAQTAAPHPAAQPSPVKPAQSAPAPAKPKAPAAAVPEDAAVITLHGVCPQPQQPGSECKQVITRAQFERLLNAVNPNIPESARRTIAIQVSQLMAMADAALKAGLDKEPAFQAQLEFLRLRLLASDEQKRIAESSKPSEQQVQTYYAENPEKFNQMEVHRLLIPKTMNGELKPAETKTIAQAMHDRAAAGEDMDKLEQEVYKSEAAKGAPPSTNLGWKDPAMLDPRHSPEVTKLKAGQVTPILEDNSAYYIYKVDNLRMIALADATPQIERVLQSQDYEQKMKAIADAVKTDLNNEYFGAESAAPGESEQEREREHRPATPPPAKPQAPTPH